VHPRGISLVGCRFDTLDTDPRLQRLRASSVACSMAPSVFVHGREYLLQMAHPNSGRIHALARCGRDDEADRPLYLLPRPSTLYPPGSFPPWGGRPTPGPMKSVSVPIITIPHPLCDLPVRKWDGVGLARHDESPMPPAPLPLMEHGQRSG